MKRGLKNMNSSLHPTITTYNLQQLQEDVQCYQTRFNIYFSLPIHSIVPVKPDINHINLVFFRNDSLVSEQYAHPGFETFSRVLHGKWPDVYVGNACSWSTFYTNGTEFPDLVNAHFEYVALGWMRYWKSWNRWGKFEAAYSATDRGGDAEETYQHL
jgi:hypothetical protein